MKRPVLAIVAAILINFILATAIDHLFHMTGVYPPYGEVYFDTDLYLLALGYRILITVFAAYITAMIAEKKAKTALWTTGILGSVLWIAGTLAMQGLGPLWYGIAGAVTALPLALLGGKLYERRMSARGSVENAA